MPNLNDGKETKMSDSSSDNGGNVPSNAPVAAEAASGPAPVGSIDNLTGEQAVALAKQAKETGKSIEELLSEQGNKSSTPKKGADGKFQSTSANEPSKDLVKDAVQEAIKKFKVKVDGQELEVDEGELLRGYSHQKAANKILQEGRQARKQAEEFLSMMKDPERFYEVAKQLGHDPRALSEKYLVSQLEEEMMDPREKEFRQMKKKLQAVEDMERKQREAVENARLEEMKSKYVKDYETQFTQALQESNLPPTKAMVGEMAKYISRSAKIGFKMEPKEAAQLVKEDIQKAQMSLIGNADGETLLKLLGDDVAKKILQARGAKVKQPGFNTPIEQGERREIQSTNKGNRRMSAKEWAEFKRGGKK